MLGRNFYNRLIAFFVLILLTPIAYADINDQVAQLDFDTATLDDVIRIFGEPTKYLWGDQTFTEDNLPGTFIARYPDGFSVLISDNQIVELRFESSAAADFVFLGSLSVGSSLEEVLAVVGPSAQTVVGQPCQWQNDVLYKDIDGISGDCYYSNTSYKVRFFFEDYKVIALFLTGKIRTSVEEYDDVRGENISRLDLSDEPNLLPTLWFNLDTVWPDANNMPPGCDPNQILTAAMNPGLGVRQLHQKGITGKGVNVAIIDQPMYLNHPEFDGKIVAYFDTGCNSESSMHGPAVASLLVGVNCGTAPDANVYYAAVPSWLLDAAYYADALDWIIEKNDSLGSSKKIRVVSVSAAPSGEGSPYLYNNIMWDDTCARAEAAGILVLDCTTNHGFIGRCWYDSNDPENVAKCTPGAPGKDPYITPGGILAPSSPRTTAEQYEVDKFGYQYCGRGGLSWSIPYCAGLLAMGWQIRPELTGDEMRQLLFDSSYVNQQGAMIINPQAFIDLVAQTPDSANPN